MHARGLITGRVGFHHVPTEQGEYFVEAGVAAQVCVVEVGVAAVAEPNVGRNQSQTRFVRILSAVVIQVQEGLRVDVRLPLIHGDVAHLPGVGIIVIEPYRRRQAIHQHIVPLVEDRDSPIAIGQTRKAEGTIRGALGKGKVQAIRVSEAHVALRESEAAVVAAAVQALIRRAAHTLGRDHACHGVGAIRTGDVRVGAVANVLLAGVDDGRVGETNRDVESGRTVLLEEARLADAEEGVMRLLAVQCIGLEPLLAAGNSIRCGCSHHAVSSRHQVGNHCLARDRGQGRAVRLELRTGHDLTGDAQLAAIAAIRRHTRGRLRGKRARIQACFRIEGSGQAVGQRHVEHVVAHLPGRIARSAGIIEQLEGETT